MTRGRRSGRALHFSMLAWVFASLLTVVLSFEPVAASATVPLQLQGALQREEGVGVVSHRGAAALAPENTLAAFELAIEQGVDFVETDVQLTSDGVAVLMHDPDVDRTTDGRGPVAAHTFEQLRELDAGGWFAPEFAGEPVPTLEQFTALLCLAPTRAFIELKGEWPAERIAEAVDLLHQHGLLYRVVLASFERPILESLREEAPEFATILLTRDLSDETVRYAIDLKVSAVCARLKLLSAHARAIDELNQAGIGTIAYTLNTEKQWASAERLGIDFFVTDDPVALAAWRDARAGEGDDEATTVL